MSVTEDYCSFELCKLLKEKGFDSPVQCTYDEYGVVSERWTEYSDDYTIRHWRTPCVTHQMAMKWLREVHNICISVDVKIGGEKYYVCISSIENGLSHGVLENEVWDTFEEACEAAIKYCLTNLI